MKNITFLLFLAIFINSTTLFAKSNDAFMKVKSNDLAEQLSERGLEIRYYVFTKKPATLPTEVVVDKVKYPLYKTKAEAIESIKFSGLKKDYTIVYVVSDKKKDSEIVALAD